MEVFEGYSIHKGTALASVARVRFDFGIPSLTSQRLRALGERLQEENEGVVETEQVILVADVLPISLIGSAIPGIEVVGVAIGGYVPETDLTPLEALLPSTVDGNGGDAFPMVAGLGDSFVRDIAEYEIVLVDGNAGRVFVAPDAYVVARHQSSTSRKRFFLDGAHVPAKTASDNRIVSVYTHAGSIDHIHRGMEFGADGVYWKGDNDLLGTDASRQIKALHEIIDAAGGQSLILDVPEEALAHSALLEAAAAAPISVVASNVESAAELARALDWARTFADSEARFGEAKILLAPPAPGDASVLPDSLEPFGGLLLRDPWQAYDFEFLLPAIGLARTAGRPVIASLIANWESAIEDIVRFAVDAVVVEPGDAASVKDAIREL